MTIRRMSTTRARAAGPGAWRVMLNLVFQLEDVIMEPHNVTPPQELEREVLSFQLGRLSAKYAVTSRLSAQVYFL